MAPDWESYRKEFPATGRYVYFNNAAVSPLSTRVRESLEEPGRMMVEEGIASEERIMARVAEYRELCGRLIGASSAEMAFTRNTTHGVLLAANSIDWRRGDNVVLPSIEFPANVYPWMGLTRSGVELRLVDPGEDGLVTAEMLADVCDARTRVVTASYVQFTTGQRLDSAELGDFCRGKGIIYHVDAIQALGALEIDVERDRIDMLSSGGHKWMTAIPGSGVFFCRRELIPELEVPMPGWTGVREPMEFLDYGFDYRLDATRFEEGNLNFQSAYSLGTAAGRFLEIGTGNVEERILSLTGRLARGLEERGFTIMSPLEPELRSGILCFRDEGGRTAGLHAHLVSNSVLCSLREGSVRLSPHFFNDDDDIDRFFKILEVF